MSEEMKTCPVCGRLATKDEIEACIAFSRPGEKLF